jgi:hypothetical protein
MKVREVQPDVDTAAVLAGAQFADAFRIDLASARLDARTAAQRMLGRSPRWVEILVALRNRLVVPFGLKAPDPTGSAASGTIGIFPVVSEAPDRVVLGFDDGHLDFRVVVDVAPCGAGQSFTLTTLVLTHNLLGRFYLAIILPFHRLIARTMLRQVAA